MANWQKIKVTRVNPAMFYSLAKSPKVDEIEDRDTDEGVFFVHLTNEYVYPRNGQECGPEDFAQSRSYDSLKEAKDDVKHAYKDPRKAA